MPPPPPVMIETLSSSRIALPLARPSAVRVALGPTRARGTMSRPTMREDVGPMATTRTPGPDRRGQRRRRGARRRARRARTRRWRPRAIAAGVSALMLSRYRFDRGTTDALLAADPELRRLRGDGARLHRPAARAARRGSGRPSAPTRPTASPRSISPASSARPRPPGRCSTPAPRSTPCRRNEMRVQPLHSAAAGRHIEVCRVLIAAGADVNATPAARLHAAPRGRPARRRSSWSSCSCRPARTRPRRDGRRATRPADLAEAAGHVGRRRARAPRGRRGSRRG